MRNSGTARDAGPDGCPAVAAGSIDAAEDVLGLCFPPGLRSLYREPPAGATPLLFRPDRPSGDPRSLTAALQALRGSREPVPWNVVPVAPVDDRSFAVVVCDDPENSDGDSAQVNSGAGVVVRWHLDDVPEGQQAALLDLDAYRYLASRVEEDAARPTGLQRMRGEAAAYDRDYVQPGKQPKSHVLRPVQLACQNVILGLGAFAYESSFDGLRVPLWQTCEVPHVAAQEGVRALTALMLCDAYRTGGTMEVRFDGHPEGRVPSALRRYARTVGVAVETVEQGVITPAEARELFTAVTPLPGGLTDRAAAAFAAGVITPERLCYTLLAGTWRALEVDYMLAVSPRAGDVLAGGSDYRLRTARSAESALCRAALLAGMLHARLDGVDAAGSTEGPREVEDRRRGVRWSVLPEAAAVHFELAQGPVPWLGGAGKEIGPAGLVVLPRTVIVEEDVVLARNLRGRSGADVALLVPADPGPVTATDLPVLRCPDSVADLDAAVERAMLTARTTRS